MLTTENITHRTRIGFIGLGHLGSPIAKRLVRAGFSVVVYDLDDAKVHAIAELGADVACNPGRLARETDVILSCLPSGSSVEAVYLREGSVLRSATPGTGIIELSTISPETSRQLHRSAQRFGLSVLDVAVSGSTLAAEAGALTLFGGGEHHVFEWAEPIFSTIAKQWFYMGPSGSGVTMKLVVNTLLGVRMQAIAEAVALGEALHLPRGLLFDALANTAVIAPAHLGKLATAKSHDYAPQFPLRLMHKDFELILAAAEQCGLSMPATEAAAAINDEVTGADNEQDFSAVIRRMEETVEAAGVTPPAAQ